MTRFLGPSSGDDSVALGYEEALAALLALIGRQVLVLFSGSQGTPFVCGLLSGRLDRGELDERLQQVILRGDAAEVETLFFHVGSRLNGFVVRPDEFESAFRQGDRQLTLHLGPCAVTIVLDGDLGEALARGVEQAAREQ